MTVPSAIPQHPAQASTIPICLGPPSPPWVRSAVSSLPPSLPRYLALSYTAAGALVSMLPTRSLAGRLGSGAVEDGQL